MPRVPAASASRRVASLVVLAAAVALALALILARLGADPASTAAAAPPPPLPPGLGDLWDGRATPVLDRVWTSQELHASPGSGSYSGAHVEIVGDRWYLFNRRTEKRTCPGTSARATSTLVRESTDRGATWGRAVPILKPTPGTEWSCAATDGDASYDPTSETWRYLFQCMGKDNSWQGCYAERHAESPLGRFSAPSPDPNPVIPTGALWSQICDPGDSCAAPPGQRAVSEEGTFGLTPAPDGGWWVGFHGYDGVHGFRGLARTRTFRRHGWQVDGAGGTPRDAIIGPGDATGWREQWDAGGPIGAGAGSMLAEGGWYYTLAEVADDNLGCTPGQHWDLGLFRTADPAAVPWEQLPAGNPLVYSSRAPGTDGLPSPCSVAYPGLFRDPESGRTYLMYGRVGSDAGHDGIYLYRLEWNRNLLRNGDFGRADLAGWQLAGVDGLAPAVERAPDRSPDGTPVLALGRGVTQDVTLDGAAGGSLAFGAEVRADAGSADVTAQLEQLDEFGQVVARASAGATAGTGWTTMRGLVALDPRTRTLRYTLVPAPGAVLHADNLFAIPQDGCTAPSYPAC